MSLGVASGALSEFGVVGFDHFAVAGGGVLLGGIEEFFLEAGGEAGPVGGGDADVFGGGGERGEVAGDDGLVGGGAGAIAVPT